MKKFVDESWLVLVMGIVFACLLAFTQTSLSGRIAENQQKALNEAIVEVVPTAADSEELLDEAGNALVKDYRVFKCLDGDKKVTGWAIQAAGTGFVDKITLVVGLSADARTITGLKVIANVETPGLGNKIASDWANQYQNLKTDAPITVQKGSANAGNNEIQAITGATWSSRYTTDIINTALNAIRPVIAKQG